MVAKSFMDYMSEEDYLRFNELIDKATEAKKNAPKAERKPRGPLTKEQLIAKKQAAIAKAQAALEALLASQED